MNEITANCTLLEWKCFRETLSRRRTGTRVLSECFVGPKGFISRVVREEFLVSVIFEHRFKERKTKLCNL